MPPSNSPNSRAPQDLLLHSAAKFAVIILSILIILALIALVVGGITKFGKNASRSAAPVSLQLPSGARIVSVDSQPGRLILRVRESASEEIDIIDTQDSHLVGQIKTSFQNAKEH